MPRQNTTTAVRLLLWVLALTVVLAPSVTPPQAEACGGFFCRQIPINQAAEQIIFRADGDHMTAVVLIQYVGEAPDFSWVVPVPGIPELSTGSAVLFQSLELATRPQFNLEVEGSPCSPPLTAFQGGLAFTADGINEDAADAVEILQSGVVGPFDTQIVSSADSQALATWLDENDYDIGERGAELIAPYVEEGMNFVALKLNKNQGVGDIRPLIMRYASGNAVIPIRLTAVAAEDDMGVLVWILGGARAVPLNFLHVIPNYTLLNWYSGSFAAYASYQGLITAAMDEAGGQGFATDYAGPLDDDIQAQLPDAALFREAHDALVASIDTPEFYRNLLFGGIFPNAQVLEILRRQLPLAPGVDEFVYADPGLLLAAVGNAAAQAAIEPIVSEILTGVIEPLEDSLGVLDGEPYLTRMYTTLSADEMTLDPEFSFNDDMAGQPLERRALLSLRCEAFRGSSWSLQLLSGTDRDGEMVLEGDGDPPFLAPTIDQPSVARAEILSEDRAPQVAIDNSDMLELAAVPSSNGTGGCGAGAGCGAGSVAALLIGLAGLGLIRGTRRG